MRTATLIFTLIVLTAAGADDLADYYWSNPNRVRVAPEEIAFTAEDIGPTKNESIFVWVYGDDGSVFLFSLFHVDSFLIDRWGMYALVVDPEGVSHWITHTPKSKAMHYREDTLEVSDGVSYFEGENDAYRLVCRFKNLDATIELESRLPPWKPGTGRLDYTDDGELYQKRFLVSPWADAHGRVSIDGRRFEIDGAGYISKTRFSNPLTRFAPYIHSLKLYSEDHFLYLLDVTLNDAYDNRVVPMFVFAEGDRWLFTTRDYRYEPLDLTQLEEIPYPYPRGMRVHAEDSGYVLEGEYREERLLNVTDIFRDIPSFIRRTLSIVISRPIYFRAAGRFEGTLTRPDGSVDALELEGPYEYTVVR